MSSLAWKTHLDGRLRLPLIGAPLFIVSNPDLVIAQCKAGIVGSFPALNARPASVLDEWLSRIKEELAAHDARHPDRPAAPFAVNQIVHRSNNRLEHDLAVCERHKVPIVITSLGARPELNQAVHGWGGVTLHDVISVAFARKAVEKGADGLIAVAAGAGGHAGTTSPFALISEIREWFDGPVALSGSIATGGAIRAAIAMGADFAYMGTPFIATPEANASERYKQMIVEGASADIVYTPVFTGVHGNYLKTSIEEAWGRSRRAGGGRTEADGFRHGRGRQRQNPGLARHLGRRPGIGAIKAVVPVGELVDRLAREYDAARAGPRLSLSGGAVATRPAA
jgi:nitronate monooxygenase